MTINGKNYLFCEKRGCEFFKGDTIRERSDMENYRVFIDVRHADGFRVCGDLMRTNVYDYSKKTPRLVYDCGLSADLQSGMYGYRPTADPRKFEYTQADVMKFVGTITGEKYDGIKWVQRFETTIPHGANFTPATLITDWAKRNNLNFYDSYFDTVVEMYTGAYKFLCYNVEQIDDGRDRVIITLEAAKRSNN